MPKAATREEKAYMDSIAQLGCILCIHLGYGASPAVVHHPRAGTGAGRRAPHLESIPLCPAHHDGPEGVHGLGVRAFERTYDLTEADLHRLAQIELERRT